MGRRWNAGATVTLVVGALVGAMLGTAGPATAAEPTYRVAVVGDSYAAGEGLGDYEWNPGRTSVNPCHRSLHSWARQMKMPGWSTTIQDAIQARNPRMAVSHLACTGATTAALLSDVHLGEGPQIARIPRDATDVFVSIGGNDVLFDQVARDCAGQSDCRSQSDALRVARGLIDSGELQRRLKAVFDAIKGRAGSARLQLVGYPRLFGSGGCAVGQVGITGPEAAALNALGDQLAAVQRAAASAARARFVDVRGHFSGHEACTGTPWIFTLAAGPPSALHPNRAGAVQYANVIQGSVSLARKLGSVGTATLGTERSITCRADSEVCVLDATKGAIWYSPGSGARWMPAAIEARYRALGSERGILGLPSSDANCNVTPTGCRQHFGGQTVYSSSRGTFHSSGQIRTAYEELGAQGSILGYPTSDRSCGLPDSGCTQGFAGGRMYSSTTTGAHFTRGQILDRYVEQLGGPRGRLGYPTNDRACASNGDCRQAFQDGRLYSATNIDGAKWVHGRILDAYRANGEQAGRLGSPTTDEIAWCGMRASFFEKGRIVWNGSVAYLQTTTSRSCPTGPTPV